MSKRVYKIDKCEQCGEIKKEVYFVKEFGMKLCKPCKNTNKKHPFLYYPEKGVKAKDSKGRLICHICGRAYDSLSSHIHTKHNISIKEYKEMFQLNRGGSLVSESVRNTCRNNNNYKGKRHSGRQFYKDHDISKGVSRRLEGINNYIKSRTQF